MTKGFTIVYSLHSMCCLCVLCVCVCVCIYIYIQAMRERLFISDYEADEPSSGDRASIGDEFTEEGDGSTGAVDGGAASAGSTGGAPSTGASQGGWPGL